MNNQTLRKVIAGLALGGALVTVPVLADTNTNGSWNTDDGKTDISYTVASNYTVVIPSAITVSTADGSYTGADRNVFINSTSTIDAAKTITVSLNAQDFEAKSGVISTIPFTVRYTTKSGTGTAAVQTPVSTLSAKTAILTQTGAQIAATNAEDTGTPTTDQLEISARVEAAVTAAQAAQADVAGTHTGAITFTVDLS